MRLTKTLYLIRNETPILDYDRLGNPIYGDPVIFYDPIPCEVEPYSNELASTRYGVFVDCTDRAFTKPDERLTLNIPIRYDGSDNYKITEVMEYDRHFEVLIKKVL